MAENRNILLNQGTQLMPSEEMLEIKKGKNNYTIGVPKESAYQENRVTLAPESVGVIIANGNRVLVERNAGLNSHFSDEEYSEAGAEIVESTQEVFQSDLILKVAPLTQNEIDLLPARRVVVSALHHTMQHGDYFRKLMQKKTTALAFEFIKDNSGLFPVLKAMSEITGYASIQIAAENLSRNDLGKGALLGGVPGITPSEVVVLGAGTVAEYACRAALGLGAVVKVFDNSIYKLRLLQNNVNSRVFTSIVQPKVLQKALKTADVVIGAIHGRNGRTPIVVTDEMVQDMKPGSVIIDVSIDQGGCIETSRITNHSDPVFVKHDVIHYCVPNIPSRVPHTASYALSNFFTPLLLDIGDEGGVERYLKSNFGFRQGVYLYNGILTNRLIADTYNIPYQELELLIAAMHM